jgi:hypothetical protein
VRAGQTAVIQEVWNGRVWSARPMRVISDAEDLIVLWFPRGTRWRAPTTPPGRPREGSRAERHATSLTLGDWTHVEAAWDVDTLQLWRPGDSHAIWVSWRANGAHWGWYVNLQLPFERTALGLRTMDLVLDVLVDPDLTWRLKDDDELAVHVARGTIKPELEATIRAEAQRVIARAEGRRAPFDEPWPEWRPDPSWPLPELPSGWDCVVE